MRIKKMLYIILGCAGVGLGGIFTTFTGISVFDAGCILFCQKSEKLNNMSNKNRWRNSCYEKSTF